MKRRGQALMDYMILLGLILLLVIPLMYLTFSNLEPYKKNKISESLEMVKDNVEYLVLLGKYASAEIIIQLPDGITNTSVEGKSISVWTGEPAVTMIVPSLVQGVFPQSPGNHYLRLFNNGTVIFFYECGNNELEAFEQCDGTANSACNAGVNYCYLPGDLRECKCSCRYDDECSTGLCNTLQKACTTCSSDSECASGKKCIEGTCV